MIGRISTFLILSLFLLVNPAISSSRETPTVKAVKSVLPSVVNISTEQIVAVRDPFHGFFNEFFSQSRRKSYRTSSVGSGVIVDDSGLILTNEHVVRRASRITVVLNNGKELEAEEFFSDAENDLALLRITSLPEDLKLHPVKLARPHDLLLGETMIAVGNPFGLGHSISKGVLSAVDRKIIEGGNVIFNDVIQTDAAINPGNSGGPLVNLDGELIGINLAIRPDAEGIGFAIPLHTIEEVLAYWLMPVTGGFRSCGLLLGSDKSGKSKIREVFVDSAAERAGLKRGDVIKSINGKVFANCVEAIMELWSRRFGTEVLFELESGKKVKVDMASPSNIEKLRLKMGVDLEVLTPQLAESLNLRKTAKGLLITDILPHSILKKSDLAPGDLIMRAEGKTLNSVTELLEIIAENKGKVRIYAISMKKYGRQTYFKEYEYDISLPDHRSNL